MSGTMRRRGLLGTALAIAAASRAMAQGAPVKVASIYTVPIEQQWVSRLHAALEAVMEGRTALVIAHRLSTIRAVDRIVVFHRGRVVEAGSHDELLAKGGVYARLYRLQFAVEELQKEEAKTAAVSAPPPPASATVHG